MSKKVMNLNVKLQKSNTNVKRAKSSINNKNSNLVTDVSDEHCHGCHNDQSDIQNNLVNYNLGIDENLRRKIDFYITPYHKETQMEKYMTFYEPKDITKGLPKKKIEDPDHFMNSLYKNKCLIDRPEVYVESEPMHLCHEKAHFHWNFLIKKLLQT